MDKKQIQKALDLVKEFSPKRNFKQTIDIIISLKEVNVKKQGEGVNIPLQLPQETGKKTKICALVDKDMIDQGKIFDHSIIKSEFASITEEDFQKTAKQYDFFVAEAKIMPEIATKFGRILGPLGKMPSPKLGSVLMPGVNAETLKKKLQNTTQIRTRNEPMVKVAVGSEDMDLEKLSSNIFSVYEAVEHALPKKEHNIKSLFIKTTMGPPIKVGMKKEDIQRQIKEKQESKDKKKKQGKKKEKTKKKRTKENKE